MAQIWRHRRAIATIFAALARLFLAPAVAQDQRAVTDLYDRPVLAVDPDMHTAAIHGQSVDAKGEYFVTGGADRTVRIWSVADGKLIRTIWIPVGPDPLGDIRAVAISPDASIIAAGGYTGSLSRGSAIYLFDRGSGAMIRRIHNDSSNVVFFLTFSRDGRYLAATLIGEGSVRVFDRDKNWAEVFRDVYDADSYGAAFASDGRLATTSFGSSGTIRLYDSNFRLIAGPVKAPSGDLPFRIAFNPDGRLLALGYNGIAATNVLDGKSLDRFPRASPTNLDAGTGGLDEIAWSPDGRTLFAAGAALVGGRFVLLAWDRAGTGTERRVSYCGSGASAGNRRLSGRAHTRRIILAMPWFDGRGRQSRLDSPLARRQFSWSRRYAEDLRERHGH